MMQVANLPTAISHGNCSLREMRVAETDENGSVSTLLVEDQPVRPSERFWTSLCANYSSYGLSTKLFKLFTHREVFDRVHDALSGDGKDRLRYTIADTTTGRELLAVTNPTKPLMEHNAVTAILGNREAQSCEYAHGVIRSTHNAPIAGVKIGGDDFEHQFVVETPIDGYGRPNIYISLLRLVCSNGMVGFAKCFRSEISLGRGDEQPSFVYERALDTFNNEEGYDALRNRIESSQRSWASIAETQKLYKLLHKLAAQNAFRAPAEDSPLVLDMGLRRASVDGEIKGAGIRLMRAFNGMTGDLASIYDLTNIDAVDRKRQCQLPARCTVYDCLNLATEAATHYTTRAHGNRLQAYVGEIVANTYDLEGSLDTTPNFTDFFTTIESN